MSAWKKSLGLRPIQLAIRTVEEFGADNGSLMAAAVSYQLLFSLFPFALAMISVAGFVMESPVYENKVINAVANLLPVAKGMITNTLHGVVNARTEIGIVALLVFIWSASAFLGSLRSSLNSARGSRTALHSSRAN